MLDEGYVEIPFGHENTADDVGLSGLEPWRSWFALRDRPGLLIERLAAWGAPEAMTASFVERLKSVEPRMDACLLTSSRGRVLSFTAPLAAERLSTSLALTRFFRVQARIEDSLSGRAFGWNAVGPERLGIILQTTECPQGTIGLGQLNRSTDLLVRPDGRCIRASFDGLEVVDAVGPTVMAELLRRW